MAQNFFHLYTTQLYIPHVFVRWLKHSSAQDKAALVQRFKLPLAAPWPIIQPPCSSVLTLEKDFEDCEDNCEDCEEYDNCEVRRGLRAPPCSKIVTSRMGSGGGRRVALYPPPDRSPVVPSKPHTPVLSHPAQIPCCQLFRPGKPWWSRIDPVFFRSHCASAGMAGVK